MTKDENKVRKKYRRTFLGQYCCIFIYLVLDEGVYFWFRYFLSAHFNSIGPTRTIKHMHCILKCHWNATQINLMQQTRIILFHVALKQKSHTDIKNRKQKILITKSATAANDSVTFILFYFLHSFVCSLS